MRSGTTRRNGLRRIEKSKRQEFLRLSIALREGGVQTRRIVMAHVSEQGLSEQKRANLNGDLVGLFGSGQLAPPTGCRVSAELPYRASMSWVID